MPPTIDRSFRHVVERLLPDVPFGVYILLRTDLESRGLVMSGSAAVAASRDAVDQRLTTPLGNKFLSFVGGSASDEDGGATPGRPYPNFSGAAPCSRRRADSSQRPFLVDIESMKVEQT